MGKKKSGNRKSSRKKSARKKSVRKTSSKVHSVKKTKKKTTKKAAAKKRKSASAKKSAAKNKTVTSKKKSAKTSETERHHGHGKGHVKHEPKHTEHISDEVAKHLQLDHTKQPGRFLGEFVYGAIDGTITTFAVVAGVTGAALAPSIVIILGFANLVADGFSMACSSYLSDKAEKAYYEKEKRREEKEVEQIPGAERQEIRDILFEKGLRDEELEKGVSVITSNKKLWVDTMMTEELGLIANGKHSLSTALMTFFGFILVGLVPLIAYVLSYFHPFFAQHTFRTATVLTLCALFGVGAIKSVVTKSNFFKSGLETLFVGGFAALIAYYIGYFLRWVVML